ncbi:MAG: hypothetical protein AAFU68_02780 [Pseudomonadota bacterium]
MSVFTPEELMKFVAIQWSACDAIDAVMKKANGRFDELKSRYKPEPLGVKLGEYWYPPQGDMLQDLARLRLEQVGLSDLARWQQNQLAAMQNAPHWAYSSGYRPGGLLGLGL